MQAECKPTVAPGIYTVYTTHLLDLFMFLIKVNLPVVIIINVGLCVCWHKQLEKGSMRRVTPSTSG